MEVFERLWRVLLLLIAWLRCAHTYIDFYVDSRQTEILYGVKTEGIFYIENGVVNQYAMTFQDQVIPFQVKSLVFHWRASDEAKTSNPMSLSELTEVDYSIHIIHTPGAIMERPTLNVSSTGKVPIRDGQFAIDFHCTGKVTGEVKFLVQIKFTYNPRESETLNFKRRKICISNSSSTLKSRNNVYERENLTLSTIVSGTNIRNSRGGPRRIPQSSSTIVALGAAAGAVALLSVLLTVMYMTRKARLPARAAIPLGLGSTFNLKSHEEYPTYSTSASSSSNARYFSNGRSHLTSKATNGQHPLPVSAQNGHRQGGYHRAMGMHRGSYATLASFTNVPVDGVSAPILTESSQRDRREYERRKNFSSAWLQQYGNGKPQPGQSIWSAQTNGFTRTRSNTLASQSRSRDVLRGASSQLTLFSNCQDTLVSQHRPAEVLHPQKNCLVLENGMLRLSPQKAKSTENLMDGRVDIPARENFDPFSASTKGTAGAAAREYLLSSQPFYANIPGNTRRSTRRHSRTPYNNTLHRSHDDLYSDINHPPYEQPFELRREQSPTPCPAPVPAVASPMTPEGDAVPADPYLNSDIYSHLMPQNFKKPKPKREAKQRAREAQGQGGQRSSRRREQQSDEMEPESRQERRRRRTNEHTEEAEDVPDDMLPRAESVLV